MKEETRKWRNPRAPIAGVDDYIADKVSMTRRALGVSQESLASSLGVTFQQIQKYEKGQNRIPSSRLYMIALALEVPIGHFFPDGG